MPLFIGFLEYSLINSVGIMIAKIDLSPNEDFMDKKKILILDKDKDICRGLEEYLKDEYDIFQCSGTDNILATIHENNIDLIITDIDLPNGYIYKFLDDLKSSAARIPVILMYVYFDCTQRMEDIIRNMVDAIFLKPFDLQELKKRIDLLLYPKTFANSSL
jgi:DNA-binding NtrC family response regulator